MYFVSTNGIKDSDPYITEQKMMESAVALQDFSSGKKQIFLDVTYTVPINFPARFLPNSKHKAVIYNYETFPSWPQEWRKYYHIPDFFFPSSNFSAEIFVLNGVPAEKTFVIPHGVDTRVFNPDVPPVKLKTKKKIKFLSVVAPHYRKNIDTMLEAYCRAFKKSDDVCFVLKTKVYKHSDGIYDATKNPNGRKGFEIVMGDVFKQLYKKYGKNIPEIELIDGHLESLGGLYTACDIFITTTGSEGFGLPFLEALASDKLIIAPKYSGHLDFLNDNNSLLINTPLRRVRSGDQYWTHDPNSWIGQPNLNHTAELMRKAYKEYDVLLNKFKPEMDKTVKRLSWENAAQQIIDAAERKVDHYKPKTYDLKAHKYLK